MPTVFVSGAAGYIGGGMIRAALAAGWAVQAGLRRPAAALPAGAVPVLTSDLATAAPALREVDTVIHAAGLGHRRGVAAAQWQRDNVDAAVNLARAARAAGVRRFVLVSTAYVLGRVHDGVVIDSTPPRPMDDYAASKLAAEREVRGVLGDQLVVLRPAAVIGPGSPGNLRLLIALLRRGVPLPFASIRNARAFIDRDDLARLALTIAAAPVPPPVLLAAHPEPIGTPALIRALAAGLGVRPRLLPCPAGLLGMAARAAGRTAMWQSLAGDFAVAPEAALGLGWRPGAGLEKQLARTARYYNTTGAEA